VKERAVKNTAASLDSVTSAGNATLAELPMDDAVAALTRVAGTLVAHQEVLQGALAEPSHADWAQRGNATLDALLALEGRNAQAQASSSQSSARPTHEGLEADIRDLYRSHGETLRILEALFDETYGYSAWDAVGNPLREKLTEYLTEAAADARTPA
jgi:hypothetical protein